MAVRAEHGTSRDAPRTRRATPPSSARRDVANPEREADNRDAQEDRREERGARLRVPSTARERLEQADTSEEQEEDGDDDQKDAHKVVFSV